MTFTQELGAPLLVPETWAKNRRRVLFYNHTGKCSGAERVLLDTVAALQQAPEEYTLFAACPTDGDLASLLEAQGVPIRAVPTLKARFTSNPRVLLGYLLSFVRIMLGFRQLVRAVAPDLLYANTVRAGIIATLSTLGTKTKIAWHVHDDLPQHPLSTLIRLTAFLSSRTAFIAVSKATATAFAGDLNFGVNQPEKARLHVLYNGVDLARFPHKSTVAPSTFRNELGLAPDDHLVVAAGMINPRKGLSGLLDAFRLVADTNPKAHLAIVGAPIFNRDDLHLADLRQQATRLGLNSNVHFTGPRKDIPAVLRAADLLVLNPLVEPFCLVLIEAIASGTPVLATRVGGIPEIITDGRTGFLVDPNNPRALAARLHAVLNDPAARARVAANALVEVASRFTKERYAKGILHLFRAFFSNNLVPPNAASPAANPIRAAVFHDNFAQNGGAERVAEELHRIVAGAYPDTHLRSTLSAEERLSPYLRAAKIRTTWMQWLPARAKLFRAYFLLYPLAVETADLYSYDLILSSCFGYAKGIRRRYGALHICYCHTPMRWVWRTEDYLARERNSRLKTAVLALPLRWLRAWEMKAATRPDLYIANSQVVADRLHRAFGVKAAVIPPPIDTARFGPVLGDQPGPIAPPEDFFLILSRLVPYKRFDLAVEACTRSHRRLVVIGDGPDRARLEALAGPTVTFLGRAPDAVVTDHAQRCRALLFPGEEDFGMTPLEVNAAGRPVVAFQGGGATETVIPNLNGVFFTEPTADSLLNAMTELEARAWNPEAIRAHAQKYDVSVFSTRILDFVRDALSLRSLTQQSVPLAPAMPQKWITP